MLGFMIFGRTLTIYSIMESNHAGIQLAVRRQIHFMGCQAFTVVIAHIVGSMLAVSGTALQGFSKILWQQEI